jgi:hypothetical protein
MTDADVGSEVDTVDISRDPSRDLLLIGVE